MATNAEGAGRMNKRRLPYDVCRCLNVDCELTRECLRFTANDDYKKWTPFAESVCVEGREAFIPNNGKDE